MTEILLNDVRKLLMKSNDDFSLNFSSEKGAEMISDPRPFFSVQVPHLCLVFRSSDFLYCCVSLAQKYTAVSSSCTFCLFEEKCS